MLLELIKIAGEKELSIEFQYSDNMYHASILDEDGKELGMFASTDVITLELFLHRYLTDPEGYLAEMKQELLETASVN